MVDENEIEPELKDAMDASLEAYSAGSDKFFDFLDDDVRVFPLDTGSPIIGKSNFVEAFSPTFLKTKRDVNTLYQDYQNMGEQVILSQSIQVTVEGVSLPVRQTVVWSKEKGRWQMSHIHNGRESSPLVVGELPTDAKEMRVLNERIATVAATVGVAQ